MKNKVQTNQSSTHSTGLQQYGVTRIRSTSCQQASPQPQLQFLSRPGHLGPHGATTLGQHPPQQQWDLSQHSSQHWHQGDRSPLSGPHLHPREWPHGSQCYHLLMIQLSHWVRLQHSQVTPGHLRLTNRNCQGERIEILSNREMTLCPETISSLHPQLPFMWGMKNWRN